ncbi:AsmA family protein [Sphingobacterium yanglingense]|uniref:AsmA protein n=1 Tax=Sphingobacterium yanglingense TaxID=1437280 RepID=A0A4R6WH15_9SPHI|nr:AsmA protein [Sphingobacterium yanglingense]
MPKKSYIIVLKRISYILTGSIAAILLAMLILPYFFKDQINNTLKEIANKTINGTLDYRDVNVSFFTHFPSLTTSVHDVQLKGSAPFQDSTLLAVKEISIGIDLLSLFKDKIVLDKMILTDGRINVLVDSLGAANYNIYTGADTTTQAKEEDTSDGQIAFKLLKLKNVDLHYSDASLPMLIEAKNIDYEGKGDLTSSIFDLKTNAKIEAFSFMFDNEKYIEHKSIDAQLITQINTGDLSFVFEKNDIRINKLPVRFKGSFAFLPNGYHLDFKLKSQESTLNELLSLVPKAYADWLKDTQVKGTSEVFMNLIGDYIADEHKMPDLSLGLIINDGYLAYKGAKTPISEWNAKFRVDLPQMNMDSLAIDLRQFEFKIANGFFKTEGHIAGVDPMNIRSTVNSSLDLGSLYQAVQWPDFTFAGQLDLNGTIDGAYATDTLTYGLRKKKEVYISSIPTFNIKNVLKNGYFKLTSLPMAIEKIAYVLEASGADNQLKNAKIALKDIDIVALNNFIKGHADIKDFQKLHLDANVQADIDLSDIKKIYPIQDVEIAGNVFVNIISKGFMDLKKNIIPETSATISMKNGYFMTTDYPVPLEEIQVETYINSKKGSLRDLSVKILPISFKLAGDPFFLNADFQNFNNIKYAVKSKGKLNLGPIYKIFALEGTNIDGYIRTDLDLAGLQSDALQGRYSRLKNDGNIDIGNIRIDTELLPQPVRIKSGKFSFKEEKLNFDKFVAQYANNELSVKGYINNIINYLTLDTDVLKGNFDIHSRKINLDDFMAFSTPSSTSASTGSSGVILLPKNLDIEVVGVADQVTYDQLLIQKFRGNLKLKDGKLALENTGFQLAGLTTDMQMNYQPINPYKAKFDFKVKADSFDIQRAYHEIPMFQQMVTSAKDAHGIISLDYELAGLLDANMNPIMPSIQGQGILSLNQIRFKNFKLLNGISQATSKEGFLDADLKKVNIHSSIKNNVMTIPRTKMKMAGFRPRFEGQVTLDGRMNIGFRLGLPPLGILGIPMRINGTSDNFKIKLGRYKEDDLDTEMDEEDKAAYDASMQQDSLSNKS